jgi:Kef-type K+ transport system membrane component KefB
MSIGRVLLDVLIVLVAAKVAAELAERAKVPAVVGEIAAGIAIGPSALGLVHSSDVLRALGELGVILLLLEVGMEMSLGELAAVGRASILVAIAGVVVPMGTGLGVTLAFGHDFNVALFMGAALAATSVGITARVFSDLRALGSVEARTVLGAAVADDVLGLVILTVVVRVVTAGSVSAWTVISVVLVAAIFLAGATIVGQRFGPVLFGFVDRSARSAGTMVALALAFTLTFASLADAAKLAPIVGAFVAGLALSQTAQREHITRELRPVGHLFVPVFFLQIGIEADIADFAKPEALAIAGALLVVAIIGKMLASVGAFGAPGDKLLIGLGMIPRGEVGLIFASIGLQNHLLEENLYAALLIVVLVTTIITPPLLRVRLGQMRGRRTAGVATGPPPEGGWLQVHDGVVDVAARPPDHRALHLGLEAALAVRGARPGPALLDWLGSLGEDDHLSWDGEATPLLLRVLQEGDARSWRFLETTGVLEKALPELAQALSRRRADPFEVDPVKVLRFELVDRIRQITGHDPHAAAYWSELAHPEWLLLAALILDTSDGSPPVPLARRLAGRLDLGAAAEQELALLVTDPELIEGVASRPDGFDEEVVLQLATHLETGERTRALAILNLAYHDVAGFERPRIHHLVSLVLDALAHPELTGLDVRNVVEARRLRAIALVGDDRDVAQRIQHAPRSYVLGQTEEELARHARLMEPFPPQGRARIALEPLGSDGAHRLDLAMVDQPGLLATVTGVLADLELTVLDAVVTTWPDGAALESFVVRARHGGPIPGVEVLRDAVTDARGRPVEAAAVADAEVAFDVHGSPWYTRCEVRAQDRPRLLHDIAGALASVGAVVHSAKVATRGGVAVDVFELTDGAGRKLDVDLQDAARAAISAGARATRRGLGRARRRTRARGGGPIAFV